MEWGGAESFTEKATAAALKPINDENEPPKILNTIPDNGAKEVPVDSLVTATFN